MLQELSKYLLSSTSVTKKNPSLKLFFQSNLNKTLFFGSWKIKNNGDKLIRIINGQESISVSSYMRMNGNVIDGDVAKYIYYMINGHAFFLALSRDSHNKLIICFGDYISDKTLAWEFSEYKWED